MNETFFQMDSLPAFVKLYLQKYGLPVWNIERTSEKKYDNIVVIPAVQEYENILHLLASLSEIDCEHLNDSMFLFVINNSLIATEEVKYDNLRTINFLRKILEGDYSENNLIKNICERGLNIGFIDASSQGKELPEKDAGVGLARKIGMDLALILFDYQSKTKKIVICLDADCTVERNYLSAVVDNFNENKMSAAHVQYKHKLPGNDIEKKAIICYELFLRYYTLGLKYADSHFAFAFIGSTMICDAESYCRIGGMNKRKAAEDFYFLEKLAKITEVQRIDSTKIYPASRSSWRVPFGTGQRITRFISNSHEEYMLYNPKTFSILKQWLKVFNSSKNINESELINKAAQIDSNLYSFLETNNFVKDWNKILRNSKTAGQIQKQIFMWFDGFKTMKLIHYLRDNGYPQINMFDAIDEMLTLVNIEKTFLRTDTIPGIDVQLEYLNLLRNLT